MLTRDREIFLGKNPFTGKAVYLPFQRRGVTLLLSKARSGKSAVAKEISLRIGESKRPLLILDSLGRGEYGAMKKMNFKAKDPKAFSDLKVLKNFALPLYAFKTIDDFISMGFPEVAASHMTKWVKNKYLQKPENMDDFLDSLPISSGSLQVFNGRFLKYGLQLRTTIFYQVKASLISRWQRVQYWFWRGKKDKRMLLTSKILQRLWMKNPWLCLQVDMKSGEEHKSCAYIGNLLTNLDDDFLRSMAPVLIVEEADLLAPNLRFNNKPLTSRSILRFFVFKKLRYNLWIIFVTQSENLLDDELVRASFTQIVGIVSSESAFYKWGKFNRLKNIDGVPRSDFAFIDVNNWSQQFYPKITSCGCFS